MHDLPLNKNVTPYMSNQRYNSDDMLHLFSKLIEKMRNDQSFVVCSSPLHILPRFSAKQTIESEYLNHTSFKCNLYHLKCFPADHKLKPYLEILICILNH